jgi:pimeloyl-ACP methyl ester carboxylesterase
MPLHDSAIRPFHSSVPEAELRDLSTRLAATRWPEPEPLPPTAVGAERWRQGVPLADLVALAEVWAADYDWRAFETRLDAIGQFRTTIDGLGIHFLHRRSSRPDAVPLIMTHGWPGSIAEFIDVVDEIADPADPEAPVFHVVIPSLPGFGFSDRPAETGWGTERTAAAWVELMSRLGYDRFLAHGGDWGGVITTILGGRFPDHVLGIHSTFAEAPPGLDPDSLTAAERAWVDDHRDFWQNRAGYAKAQAWSPQTVGYALVDSPVGQMAWILDKLAEWSDTDNGPFETMSRDRVLDNITLYWLTGTGASAARIYAESHNSLDPALRIDVPAAITMYPADVSSKCPRPWAEQRYRRIVRWREPVRGGHFPSLEMPEHFVDDLRAGLAAVLAANR